MCVCWGGARTCMLCTGPHLEGMKVFSKGVKQFALIGLLIITPKMLETESKEFSDLYGVHNLSTFSRGVQCTGKCEGNP